ncbi:MAG: 4-coumarate--CoA ligase family protein [Actinomycetota bacterium]|nr:4-coumarate--CoA ligase family protein [Actinomycetota bacterium]
MIFTSPYPDAAIDEVPLGEFVLKKGAELGEKAALIDGPSGRTLTYGQLVAGVKMVAAGLHERGFRKGDVFAIYSPNVPEYVVAYLAVASIGGINTTASPLYTADELTFQLNDADAKYLLTIPQLLEVALKAAAQSNVREVFVLGEAEGATPFASLMQGGGEAPAVEIDVHNDLVALPYSSGTTGLPKGVMLTHRNLVGNICQTLELHRTTESDRLMGVLPFFHIYGQQVIMNAGLFRGATIVTMPRFDLEQFLQIMQEHKITRAYLVPPIVLALAKHPLVDKFDLSELQLILSGAAPLGEELQQAVENRLGCRAVQGYGLTETSPVTHVTADDDATAKAGSIGHLVPNTEAKLVDVESGEELGPNERGELWVRGPQIMKGYLNNKEATAHTIDADAFLHTGDIGYVDDDGYFFIVDRLKELIKYKGFQVPPAELEALLLGHEAVADAAVIPVPDEEAGEIPKAFVVASGDIDPDALMAWVAERVAAHKKIRQVEVVEEIPKSPSGKILRRVLVERERARLG